MFYCSSRIGSCPVLMLVLTALAIAAPAVALEVTPVTQDVELTIGDSLFVTRDGLAPDRLYRAILTDEAGFVIVDEAIKPDVGPDPVAVWSSTGVVGCDPKADPSPGEYRFTFMEEAEDALKNRFLQLAVLDDATQSSLARITLQLKVREVNQFFFSDQTGCPRCQYAQGEPVYITGSRVVHDLMWMFLVEAAEERPALGDPLDDFSGEPRRFQPSSSHFTELVTDVLPVGPLYLGALVPDDGSDEPPDVLTPTGYLIDPTWFPCPSIRLSLTGISSPGGDKGVCP